MDTRPASTKSMLVYPSTYFVIFINVLLFPSRTLRKTIHSNTTNWAQHSFTLVGVDISKDLIWDGHIVDMAVAAEKMLGFLFRERKYFSASNLTTLYKAEIRPRLEYCSSVWAAAAPTTLAFLDKVTKTAILASRRTEHARRRAMSDLSLLYLFSWILLLWVFFCKVLASYTNCRNSTKQPISS